MKQTYYRHKLQNLLVINKIVTIHYFEYGAFERHGEAHDFWELVYADRGNLIYEIGGEECLLREGEILFHKPNEYHVHIAKAEHCPNIFIISFECKSEAIRFFEEKRLHLKKDLLRYIYMIMEESRRTFLVPYPDPELKKMPLHPHPALGGQQLIKNLLEILLINIMRDESERDNAESVFLMKEELDNHIANRIKEYLRAHVREDVSVSEIAATLNYNKSYLFRQFKASTGHTIMAYFLNMKIEETKKALRETDRPVAQIAAEYAFDTPNYFSNTFKRATGISPTTYRKRERIKK
ncbi:MAG: helix-turn-helix transcriptional regulator [Clostridia bacterium]|nr:helix-turn-helix transcriptional regulator [Clostridia bacterium]